MLDTVPWAVPEEGAGVAGVGLSSMSLDEELLYEPNKVIEQMVERKNKNKNKRSHMNMAFRKGYVVKLKLVSLLDEPIEASEFAR